MRAPVFPKEGLHSRLIQPSNKFTRFFFCGHFSTDLLQQQIKRCTKTPSAWISVAHECTRTETSTQSLFHGCLFIYFASAFRHSTRCFFFCGNFSTDLLQQQIKRCTKTPSAWISVAHECTRTETSTQSLFHGCLFICFASAFLHFTRSVLHLLDRQITHPQDQVACFSVTHGCTIYSFASSLESLSSIIWLLSVFPRYFLTRLNEQQVLKAKCINVLLHHYYNGTITY
jgi:hypothetical protein